MFRGEESQKCVFWFLLSPFPVGHSSPVLSTHSDVIICLFYTSGETDPTQEGAEESDMECHTGWLEVKKAHKFS